MSSRDQLQTEVDAVAGWYHSIDLGDGIVTPGIANSDNAIRPDRLPSFAGRTVLDIGAWDGYYSFLAEREGAKSVTALDHYAWGIDWVARDAYWRECKELGVLPDHERDATDFFNPDLPGRRGFDLAKRVLASGVEPIVADFATTDLDPIGQFDVVLYLGVLYHMKEPIHCLERVRAVTREVAVIETVAFHLPAFPHHSLLELHPGGDLNTDYGNWFVPTINALKGLALAAGFARVEVAQGPPEVAAPPAWVQLADRVRRKERPAVYEYRAIVHAYV